MACAFLLQEPILPSAETSFRGFTGTLYDVAASRILGYYVKWTLYIVYIYVAGGRAGIHRGRPSRSLRRVLSGTRQTSTLS